MIGLYTLRTADKERPVRTNIEIDDGLMRQAMDAGTTDTGETPTKKATVEAALRLFVQTRSQGGIRQLRGRVRWEGNLEQSRRGRGSE
jgi:Arc/MetJ family transcription regulator